MTAITFNGQNFRRHLEPEEVLSEERLKKHNRPIVLKDGVKHAAGTIGVTTIIVSSIATQYDQPAKLETATVSPKTYQIEKQETKIASEIAYNSKLEFGKEYENVGEMTKPQVESAENSMNRPVNIDNVAKIETAGVVKTEEGESFNPFITYEVNDSFAFVPGDGKVFDVNGNEVVIEHKLDDTIYYSILKGVESSFEVGYTVTKGERIGAVIGGKLNFAIAQSVNEGEYSEFIHPNMFVDIPGSDAYRYGSFEYYSKPNLSVSEEAKGTVTEKIIESAPEEVKNSVVTRGFEAQNEIQANKALKPHSVFFENKALPIQVIEGGKANVSENVRKREPLVKEILKEEEFKLLQNKVEFILSILQHESGGREDILSTDPFQASQSKSGKIGSIQDPEESIRQGLRKILSALQVNNMFDPINFGDVRFVPQTYNFGDGLGRDAAEDDVYYNISYVYEKAIEYKEAAEKRGLELMELKNEWRGDAKYGNFLYALEIFAIFSPDENWEVRAEAAETEYFKKIEAEKAAQKELEQKQKDDELKRIESIKNNYKEPTVKALPKSDILKGKVVVLDAGHGGNDIGAPGVDGSITEADLNLKVTLMAKTALEAQGATILLTRSTRDGFLEPGARGQFADNNNADLFVSFHNNALNSKSTGSETHYEAGNEQSKKLANSIQSYLGQAMGMIENRGIVPRGETLKDSLAIFRESKSVGALIEPGFMSNINDLTLLKNEVLQESIVNAVTRGVLDYFGLQVEEATEEKEQVNSKKAIKIDEQKNSEEKKVETSDKKEKKEDNFFLFDIFEFEEKNQ